MKKILTLITSVSIAFAPYATLAQTVCKSNGIEVPCANIFGDNTFSIFSIFAGGFIILWLAFFAIMVVGTIFWIYMIVHAINHDIKDKPMWIILLVFTHLLGALIYYFVIKKPFDKMPPKNDIPV